MDRELHIKIRYDEEDKEDLDIAFTEILEAIMDENKTAGRIVRVATYEAEFMITRPAETCKHGFQHERDSCVLCESEEKENE